MEYSKMSEEVQEEVKVKKVRKSGPRKTGVIYKATGAMPMIKLQPQQQDIIDIIANDGVDGQISRGELLQKMSAQITTVQPVARLLAYHTPLLVSAGLIQVIEPVKPVKEDNAE
jgi:hypothetical protein